MAPRHLVIVGGATAGWGRSHDAKNLFIVYGSIFVRALPKYALMSASIGNPPESMGLHKYQSLNPVNTEIGPVPDLSLCWLRPLPQSRADIERTPTPFRFSTFAAPTTARISPWISSEIFRECSRLQGFPKEFNVGAVSDVQNYRQFGNSVSMPVMEAIAAEMKPDILSREDII